MDTFEELEKLSRAELLQKRDEARDALHEARESRFRVIGQIMFYQQATVKEYNR